jgi:hypothetical protein
MTWHADAEQWAHDAAAGAADVPVIMYAPTAATTAAPLYAVVGPASMSESTAALSGRLDAVMAVDVTVAASGDTPAAVQQMTAQVDAIVAGLSAAGAISVTTAPGLQSLTDTTARATRTITATVAVFGECQP